MTDEMAIQGQRPSAIPYVLGGAALGGAAGYGAAVAGYGLKAPAYKNWQEAVDAVNKDDKFVSEQIKKSGDNKANWETIKNEAKAVKDAEEAAKKITLPEGSAKAELDTVVAKELALDNAQKAIDKKYQAAFDNELANLKKMEIKADAPYEFKGVKYNQESFRTLLNSTKEEDKKLVEELVKDTKGYKDVIGAEDFAKAEKAAKTEAENALNTAKEAFAKKNVGDKAIAEDIVAQYTKAHKGVAAAKNNASEKISKNVLDKCKKVSNWKTAAVGAAVLALAGLMVRPKGE